MSFTLDLQKFNKKYTGRGDTLVKKVVLDIDRGVVMSTPVDTGRARGGWNVGVNSVDLTERDPDKSGQTTISRNTEKTQREVEAGDQVFLSNNVEYIEYLEKGSSDQAPNGMVEKTLQRFPGIVRKGVNEAKKENP